MRMVSIILLSILDLSGASPAKKKPQDKFSSLEQYITDVNKNVRQNSLCRLDQPIVGGRMEDTTARPPGEPAYDLVYIVVADKASAVSSGVTNTDRKSSAKSAITSLMGPRTTQCTCQSG